MDKDAIQTINKINFILFKDIVDITVHIHLIQGYDHVKQ